MSKGAEARATRMKGLITAAAADQFLDKGFLGASMDEISTIAGVSKQTVYAHFESKEALFLAVVRGLTGGAGDDFQGRLADATGEEPVDEYLMDFATLQLRIVMTPRLMQLRRLVIGEVSRFPELGRALHEKARSGRSNGWRAPSRSIATSGCWRSTTSTRPLRCSTG